MRKILSLPLWKQIVIAMVLGVAVGVIIGPDSEQLKPLGTLFIRMIKMLVVPLVLVTLIAGVTSMEDTKAMGRMGLKAFFLYLFTTMFAISIGLAISSIIQPGVGFDMGSSSDYTPPNKEAPGIVAMILNIVPTNPIKALTDGNMLQIIFFALMIGLAISLSGKKAAKLAEVNNAACEAMFKLTHMVMYVAPFGVFGLMAWVAGTQDVNALISLAKLVVSFGIALILHIVLVYGGIIFFYLKLNPWQFVLGIKDAMAVAFSTASSSATLPVTMEVAQDNLGVSKQTASFVLPLGTTINMDGTALYQGICVLFIAQSLGVDLTSAQMVTVVLTATLASIGTAGIPGAGLIMLTIVLDSVGLPADAIGVILAIDRILDMCRTTINVTGDCTVALFVDKTEGRFNEKIFKEDAVI